MPGLALAPTPRQRNGHRPSLQRSLVFNDVAGCAERKFGAAPNSGQRKTPYDTPEKMRGRKPSHVTPAEPGSVWQDLYICLHYVLDSHDSPICLKRSGPWDVGKFFLHIHALLGRAKFSHGHSRYPYSLTGREEKGPAEYRRFQARHGRQYVSCRPITF